MKKLLVATLLGGVLVLGACSNDEQKADSKDSKSESVEKKKDTSKK